MKKPQQQAERWLRQADHDLLVAQTQLQSGFFSDCCFMAEQIAQKALKAFLYAQGERAIAEHSVKSLMKRAMASDRRFEPLIEEAAMLDQYYIPTRYPDALAEPAVPFESYTKDQATKAIASAQRMFTLVKQSLSQ